MKNRCLIAPVLALLGSCFSPSPSHAATQPDEPLRLIQTIKMAGNRQSHTRGAFDAKRNRLYLATLVGNAVDIMDAADGKILRRIQPVAQPQGLLYLPESDALVVSSTGRGQCLFYNAETFELIKSIDDKKQAGVLRLDAATNTIVLGYHQGLCFIDPATHEALADVTLDGLPATLAVESGVGGRAFVSYSKQPVIAVVDRGKASVSEKWEVEDAGDAFHMALDQANHRLFLGCRTPGRLVVLDSQTGKLIAEVGMIEGCNSLWYDADAKCVYASCDTGTLDVFGQLDADQYKLLARIPTLGTATAVFAPEQKRLFVIGPESRSGEASLQIYETSPASNVQSPKPNAPSTKPIAQSKWDFDEDAAGKVPEGWKIESTRQRTPLATWQVIEDQTTSSPPHVLAMTATNHGMQDAFNLCWTDRVQFQDGQIELSFKAVAGEVDQGGGPIWRVKDSNNYYLCRFNPLEENFRVYTVKDGNRTQLASVKVDLPEDQWHAIKVRHRGDHIECSLNGSSLLDVRDSSLPGAGGIGLWTKADARTLFDNLFVVPSSE